MLDRVVPITMTEEPRNSIGMDCISRYVLASIHTGHSILGESAEYIKSTDYQHAFDESLELSPIADSPSFH